MESYQKQIALEHRFFPEEKLVAILDQNWFKWINMNWMKLNQVDGWAIQFLENYACMKLYHLPRWSKNPTMGPQKNVPNWGNTNWIEM